MRKQTSRKAVGPNRNRSEPLGALLSQAIAAHQQGQLAGAARDYERILGSDPHYFDALHYLGIVKLQQGQIARGIELIETALTIRPNAADAMSNLANGLISAGRHTDALRYLDRSLDLAPRQAEAHTNRGVVLAALKRFEEAAAAHEQALKIRPDFLEALNNHGNALRALGRYDGALSAYDSALRLHANYPEALNNRGLALTSLQRWSEAVDTYDKALSLRPNYPEAHNNRGSALKELGDFDAAFAAYAQALGFRPGYAEALYNRGNTFAALNRHEEALDSYNAALALQPEHIDANWNKGISHMLLGQTRAGWLQYEWRWQVKNADAPRSFDCPRWEPAQYDREDLTGKRILLWAEQGLGDTLQFCRYASLLAQRGAAVVLEVQKPLVRLLRSLSDASAVIARGESHPAADLHCPLLSVPLTLDEASIPAGTPYLNVPADTLQKWQMRIDDLTDRHSHTQVRLRIGISCSGNPKLANDRNRSIPLEKFAALLDLDVDLFLVQKECRGPDEIFLHEHPRIHDLRLELDDFTDTAAAVKQMDLLISVDTSVAHLAGALHHPVWVLLPFVPDWRWRLGRSDSPWYPTARLWRQATIGDWDTVIAQITAALQAKIQTRH